MSCRENYNTIVTRAKSALQRGDRNGALELLLDARRVAASCPEVETDPSLRAVIAANYPQSSALLR